MEGRHSELRHSQVSWASSSSPRARRSRLDDEDEEEELRGSTAHHFEEAEEEEEAEMASSSVSIYTKSLSHLDLFDGADANTGAAPEVRLHCLRVQRVRRGCVRLTYYYLLPTFCV